MRSVTAHKPRSPDDIRPQLKAVEREGKKNRDRERSRNKCYREMKKLHWYLKTKKDVSFDMKENEDKYIGSQ